MPVENISAEVSFGIAERIVEAVAPAKQKYKVDLLSAGPDRIDQIPPDLFEQGMAFGWVILTESDPRLTLLVLRGFRCDPVIDKGVF